MDKWAAVFLFSFVALLLIAGGIIVSGMFAARDAEQPDVAENIPDTDIVYVEENDAAESEEPKEDAVSYGATGWVDVYSEGRTLAVNGAIDGMTTQGNWVMYYYVQNPTDDEPLTLVVGRINVDEMLQQEMRTPFAAAEARIVGFDADADGHRLLVSAEKDTEWQLYVIAFDSAGFESTRTEIFEQSSDEGGTFTLQAVFTPDGELVVRVLLGMEGEALYVFAPDGTLRNRLTGTIGDLILMWDGRIVAVSQLAMLDTVRELNIETGEWAEPLPEPNPAEHFIRIYPASAQSEFDLYFVVVGGWLDGYDTASGSMTALLDLSVINDFVEGDFIDGVILGHAHIAMMENGHIAIFQAERERLRVVRTHLLVFELVMADTAVPM